MTWGIATVSGLQAATRKLDAFVAQIDVAVRACTGNYQAFDKADAATTTEWVTWLLAYKVFSNSVANLSSVELFGLGAVSDQIEQYQSEANAWDKKFSSLCPSTPPQAQTQQDLNNQGVLPQTSELLKDGAILLGVGLLGYLAITYLPKGKRR